MLIFQIKKIISREKRFNYEVTFFIFFENAKNLGHSDDTKWRKTRGWPSMNLKLVNNRRIYHNI